MIDGKVQLLNLISLGLGNLYTDVCQLFELAVALSCQSDDMQSFGLCSYCRKKNITAISRSGDTQEYVVCLSLAIHLLGKNQFRITVVHEGGG